MKQKSLAMAAAMTTVVTICSPVYAATTQTSNADGPTSASTTVSSTHVNPLFGFLPDWDDEE